MTAAGAAHAQTAIDGNTIRLDDRTYRLWGIDAPSPRQTCERHWPAGEEAINTLTELMRGKTVDCQVRDKDRYGRTLATCLADGVDLGSEMVSRGMAWAILGQKNGYIVQEAKATAAYRGIHAHRCQTAKAWRKSNGVEEQFKRQDGDVPAFPAEK